MTVNEIITQLQKMISNGEITGNERFGSFKWADDYGEYFDEAEEISIQEKWKDWDDMGRNLKYGMIEEFRKAMLDDE